MTIDLDLILLPLKLFSKLDFVAGRLSDTVGRLMTVRTAKMKQFPNLRRYVAAGLNQKPDPRTTHAVDETGDGRSSSIICRTSAKRIFETATSAFRKAK